MDYNKANNGFGKDRKSPEVLPQNLPIYSWLLSQRESSVMRWLR
jgi:hypothetical protein